MYKYLPAIGIPPAARRGFGRVLGTVASPPQVVVAIFGGEELPVGRGERIDTGTGEVPHVESEAVFFVGHVEVGVLGVVV